MSQAIPISWQAVAKRIGTGALLAGLLVFIGCGSDSKKNPASPGGTSGGSTTVTGLLTAMNQSGKITLTIATSTASLAPGHRAAALGAALVTATGSATIVGGGTVSLTGNYDPDVDTVGVSGGGYRFFGHHDIEFTPPAITGLYSGPGVIGNFVCPIGDGTAVKVYCGQFQNTDASHTGRWNFLTAGTNVVGYAGFVQDRLGGTGSLFLFGTVTGSGATRQIGMTSDTYNIILSATGTLTTATDSVTGIWDTTDNGSGTWSGALCP